MNVVDLGNGLSLSRSLPKAGRLQESPFFAEFFAGKSNESSWNLLASTLRPNQTIVLFVLFNVSNFSRQSDFSSKSSETRDDLNSSFPSPKTTRPLVIALQNQTAYFNHHVNFTLKLSIWKTRKNTKDDWKHRNVMIKFVSLNNPQLSLATLASRRTGTASS